MLQASDELTMSIQLNFPTLLGILFAILIPLFRLCIKNYVMLHFATVCKISGRYCCKDLQLKIENAEILSKSMSSKPDIHIAAKCMPSRCYTVWRYCDKIMCHFRALCIKAAKKTRMIVTKRFERYAYRRYKKIDWGLHVSLGEI